MMALGISLRMAIVSDHAHITTLVVTPNVNYEKKDFLLFSFSQNTRHLALYMESTEENIPYMDQMALTLDPNLVKKHQLHVLRFIAIIKKCIIVSYHDIFFSVPSSLV